MSFVDCHGKISNHVADYPFSLPMAGFFICLVGKKLICGILYYSLLSTILMTLSRLLLISDKMYQELITHFGSYISSCPLNSEFLSISKTLARLSFDKGKSKESLFLQ